MITIHLTEIDKIIKLDKESTFALNKSVSTIKDISKRKNSFSKDFDLKGTDEINEILNLAFNGNVINDTYNKQLKIVCNVYDNGNMIFQNGLFKIEEIENKRGNITYKCSVKSSLNDFFTTIKQRNLTDLQFSTQDIPKLNTFIYLPTSLYQSYLHTFTDGFKMVTPNSQWDSVNNRGLIHMKEYYCAIYGITYFKRIFTEAGYRINFPEEGITNSQNTDVTKDDLKFKKLLIPYTQAPSGIDYTKSNYYSAKVKNNGVNEPVITGGNGFMGKFINFGLGTPMQNTVEVYDYSASYNPATLEYTANYDCIVKLKVTTEYNAYVKNDNITTIYANPNNSTIEQPIQAQINVLVNGELAASSAAGNAVLLGGTILSPGTTTIAIKKQGIVEIQVNLAAGDKLQVWTAAYVDNVQPLTIQNILGQNQKDFQAQIDVTYQTVEMNIFIDDTALVYNDLVNFNKLIPSMGQDKFIKSIINMYNLYIEPDELDPFLLNVYSRDYYYNQGQTIDINKYVDISEPIVKTKISDDFKKRTVLKYKDGEDTFNKTYKDKYKENYGSAKYTVNNEYIGEEEDKIEIDFTLPTFVNEYNRYTSQMGANKNIYVLYDGGVRETEWYSLKCGFNQPISAQKWYSVCTHFDNPAEPTYSLEYGTSKVYYYDFTSLTNNNLFNNHYRRQFFDINEGDKLELTMIMDSTLYNQLKLNSVLYYNEKYYIIDNIKDYQPNKTRKTKVTLLSFNKDKFAVAPIIPIGDVIKKPSKGDIFTGKRPNIGNALTIGLDNIINGNDIVTGNDNNSSGNGNIVYGDKNVLSGNNNNVTGSKNAIQSNGADVIGTNNIVYGDGAIVQGNNNTIQSNAQVYGDNNNIAETAINSIVLGNNNNVNGSNVVVIGNDLEVDTDNVIVTDHASITVCNYVVAGMNEVLSPFNEVKIINFINAGRNSVLDLGSYDLINKIDAKRINMV